MRNFIKNFANDESGATAIEYGLIAATMATAVIAAFAVLTPALRGAFQSIASIINPTTP